MDVTDITDVTDVTDVQQLSHKRVFEAIYWPQSITSVFLVKDDIMGVLSIEI